MVVQKLCPRDQASILFLASLYIETTFLKLNPGIICAPLAHYLRGNGFQVFTQVWLGPPASSSLIAKLISFQV